MGGDSNDKPMAMQSRLMASSITVDGQQLDNSIDKDQIA